MDESEEDPKSKEGEGKRRSKRSNSSVARHAICSAARDGGWVGIICKR